MPPSLPPPAPPRNPRLQVEQGPEAGRTFPLHAATAHAGTWTIGRGDGAAVDLAADPFVSRRHTLLRRQVGGFDVVDLPTSRNGTRLNGQMLKKGVAHRLRPGDKLQVGDCVLRFQVD